MGVHVVPELVFTFSQNSCSRCAGICKIVQGANAEKEALGQNRVVIPQFGM